MSARAPVGAGRPKRLTGRARRRRLHTIERWWAHGSPGVFRISRRPEPRVRAAFRHVALRLSVAEWRAFRQADVKLLSEPDARGAVFFCRRRRPFPLLYLVPVVARLGPQSLRALVAHEVAHVVLGHPPRPGSPRCEAAADRLAGEWGFPPAYPRGKRTPPRDMELSPDALPARCR